MKIKGFFPIVKILLVLGIISLPQISNGWKTDFKKFVLDDELKKPKDWILKGTKWGVNTTSFFIKEDAEEKKNVLVIDADKATATIIYDLSKKVNLKKTPVMRWTWRVKSLPAGADGRVDGKDDQAIAIYIGSGTFTQKSIAYRWETDTPKGYEASTSYGGGLVSVKWFCVNNKTDSLDKWVTLERNIAEDYKKAYGFIPEKFAITIAGNSQYTESHTVGEILEIEFVEE